MDMTDPPQQGAPMVRRPARNTFVVACLALIVPLLTPILLAPTGAPTAEAAALITKRFAPKADTYVQRDQPKINFGTSTRLRVDAGPKVITYLKFKVKGFRGEARRAILRIYATAGHEEPSRLHVVKRTKWGERKLRWGNKPRVGRAIASTGPVKSGTWVKFNVTKQVKGNGGVAFAITTRSKTSRVFESREGTRKPRLVVTGRKAPAPPPPEPSPPPPEPSPTPPPEDKGVVVAAAGDVACDPADPGYNNGNGIADRCHMKATSNLIVDLNPAQVFALGDLQYEDGTLEKFNTSYDPTWGRFKGKTRPVVGNHEYGTAGAAGYFQYFGDRATPRQPGCRVNCDGYYSFDVGQWHAVVLNTECAQIEGGQGCAAGSAQQTWLAADLKTFPAKCTVALLHKPRWSSNLLVEPGVAPLVKTLYDHGVDLMLAGHSHAYERFAPQSPDGQLDQASGIRQIVVGTGGSFFTGFANQEPNSEVQQANVFGVLKLVLKKDSYEWDFLADPSTPFTDTGKGTCH